MKKLLPLLLLSIGTAFWCDASVLITNGLTHVHEMVGAKEDKGVIYIKNVGDQPERLEIYFRDLMVDCENDNQYVDPGTTQRSNAGWIRLSTEEKILQPGEEFPLRYDIRLPNEDLAGSFWSLLMVEVKRPIDTASMRFGVSVNSNIRYAIQLITNVGSSNEATVDFANVDVMLEKRSLNVTLQNGGDKMVVPKLNLEIYDETGELIATQKAQPSKLYPGQCRAFVVPLGNLRRGKYQGVVVADCGNANLFGVTMNLQVDE